MGHAASQSAEAKRWELGRVEQQGLAYNGGAVPMTKNEGAVVRNRSTGS